MKIIEIIINSIKNLTRRKARTLLTTMGIMLGTCSLVITFAFSYTLIKNAEDKFKNDPDLTKIYVRRKKYDSTKGKQVKQKTIQKDPNADDITLDYGKKLVKKLEQIPNVKAVLPVIYGMGPLYFTCKNQYISLSYDFEGIDFSKPELLKEYFRSPFILTPSGKYITNNPNAKTINVVIGALFPYTFWDLKAKNYDDVGRNFYEMLDTGKDKEPFFDINKEKLKGMLITQKTEKQVNKIVENVEKRVIKNMSNDDFGEDDNEDKDKDKDAAEENISFDKIQGKKYDINITGILTTENGFDTYKNRNLQKLKELDDEVGCVCSILSKVYVDINTAQELKKSQAKADGKSLKDIDAYKNITVIAKDPNDVQGIVDYIQKKLNYKVECALDDIKAAQDETAGIRFMLLSLGIITIIVSALGIANMMTMAVSERAKEIGIMKVLGCSLGDIRAMFLAESGMIGFIGGTFGVLLSMGITKTITMLVKVMGNDEFVEKTTDNALLGAIAKTIRSFASMVDFTEGKDAILIPTYIAIGGIIFGILVGLVSGFRPANKATKISALSAIKTQN